MKVLGRGVNLKPTTELEHVLSVVGFSILIIEETFAYDFFTLLLIDSKKSLKIVPLHSTDIKVQCYGGFY